MALLLVRAFHGADDQVAIANGLVNGAGPVHRRVFVAFLHRLDGQESLQVPLEAIGRGQLLAFGALDLIGMIGHAAIHDREGVQHGLG